jgi:hypothetical protein
VKPPGTRARLRRVLAAVVGLAVLAGVLVVGTAKPSHDRAWPPEQAVLPSVEFDGRLVHVRGVRDFRHDAAGGPAAAYDDRTYDLDRLDRVWYVLSPFGTGWRGPAHSFLTFGFADSAFVSISVEARRPAGAAFSPVKGALRRFELMYVIGDERDVIGLRALTWDDPVHLYPLRATPEQARALFVEMLKRAREIERRPEFYNTFTNNCATNILAPVNLIATRRIPYGMDVLFPGYSDRLAHRLGLIDTELPLDEARERFRINERARAAADDPDFSLRIRE